MDEANNFWSSHCRPHPTSSGGGAGFDIITLGTTSRMFRLINTQGLPAVSQSYEDSFVGISDWLRKGCPPRIPRSMRLWFQQKRALCGAFLFHGIFEVMQIVSVLAIVSGIELAIIHVLAMQLLLYWRYWWLDIPVHVFGGAFVALGAVAIFGSRASGRFLPVRMFAILAMATLVGWEIFGIILENGLKPNFYTDTTIDLISGALGAAIGYTVARFIYTSSV